MVGPTPCLDLEKLTRLRNPSGKAQAACTKLLMTAKLLFPYMMLPMLLLLHALAGNSAMQNFAGAENAVPNFRKS